MRRLRSFFFAANRPLQDRLAILIASAVAAAVAATGIAAYAMTLLTVYDQLDNELVEVASLTSGTVSEDLDNMGGIDTTTWRAADGCGWTWSRRLLGRCGTCRNGSAR